MATNMASSWRAAVRAFCIGVAVWLAGPAHAAVYTGIWDPPFGAPFTADLGWRGTATFSLPPGCLTGTGDLDNADDCGGNAVVTQATVELYDVDTPITPLAILVFDAGSLEIQTLRFDDGDLVGLSTGLSDDIFVPGGLGSYGVSAAMGFALRFSLDLYDEGPQLGVLDTACTDECDRQFNDAANFPPQFRIRQVSEPGSAALGALALGLLAAARRRRR